MKKIPLKWKFFLVFNYLQLVSFGVILLALTISIIKERSGTPDSPSYMFVALGLLLICLNNFLNIYTIHRYFPYTLIPTGNKILMKITGIISILSFAVLLCLFIYGLTEELSAADEPDRDKTGIYILILLFFLLTTGIYILILQFGMFRYLKRNHKAQLDSLINSIGTE